MVRVRVACLLVVALLGSPVLANHLQPAGAGQLAFDHVKGNEWWVEVALSGSAASGVARVEAQDTGGSWVALEKKSWGPYAGSFHIEPGHQVQFRATLGSGAQVSSCPFTHPAGLEQCAASSSSSWTFTTTGSSSTSTSAAPALDASFTGVRGNEWWIQAGVATNGAALAKVEATLDGGASYKPLAKQSWGGWAASFRIVQGSTVQLKATSTAGASDLSDCYRWIPASGADAAKVPCAGSATTSSSASTSPGPTSSSTTTTALPRPVWSSRALGDAPGFAFGMAIGDASGDGRPERFVLGEEGLFLAKAGGLALLDERSWHQGFVADGDNDGDDELYALGLTPNGQAEEIRRLTIANGAVASDSLVFVSSDFAGPFAIVDLDGDGLAEFYVGSYDAGSGAATLLRVDYDGTYRPADPVFELGNGGGSLHVSGLADGVVGGVRTLAATATGDVDGDDRLDTRVYAITSEGDGLAVDLLGTFHDDPAGLAVGDADGDGAAEVLAANMTRLHVFRPAEAGWTAEVEAPLPEDIMDIAFADADGDGDAELHAGSSDGHLYAVAATASGLRGTPIAELGTADDLIGPLEVAAGNGDGDAGDELYTLTLVLRPDWGVDTRLAETGLGLPPATPAFDATFTGVKGNGWWVQASVSATEPLAGVDARVECGPWKPLAKQSWGGWAASFQVPSGSKVDFRARSASGASDLSGGYVWPMATPTAGC